MFQYFEVPGVIVMWSEGKEPRNIRQKRKMLRGIFKLQHHVLIHEKLQIIQGYVFMKRCFLVTFFLLFVWSAQCVASILPSTRTNGHTVLFDLLYTRCPLDMYSKQPCFASTDISLVPVSTQLPSMLSFLELKLFSIIGFFKMQKCLYRNTWNRHINQLAPVQLNWADPASTRQELVVI